jgi:hypothetical protein
VKDFQEIKEKYKKETWRWAGKCPSGCKKIFEIGFDLDYPSKGYLYYYYIQKKYKKEDCVPSKDDTTIREGEWRTYYLSNGRLCYSSFYSDGKTFGYNVTYSEKDGKIIGLDLDGEECDESEMKKYIAKERLKNLYE